MFLLLLACTQPVDFCQGDVRLRYAEGFEEGLTVYPDDHWTVEDSSTTTGLRVDMSLEDEGLSAQPENYADWFDFVSTLDGFGLSSDLFFRFAGKLDPSVADDVFLIALTDDGPVEYDPQVTFTDVDQTLMLRPRRALPSSTRIVAGLRTDPTSESCAAPSPYLMELLDPEGRKAEHPLTDRFQEGLAATGLDPSEIAAMTVFTTQSAHEQALQVVDDIATLDPELTIESCTPEGAYQRCEGVIEIVDYRVDGVVPVGPVEARSTYDLDVRIWAPLEPGPHPMVLCGHGLGGDRDDCDAIVDKVTTEGVALVGVDAQEHGDHPARSEAELELIEPLMIFAIRVNPPGLHGLKLRDNFRASAWDKLQLLAALEQGVDLDGDGEDDLDGDRIGYAGVSLGAIMGPEPLALSGSLQGGLMYVGGARITQIIQDSPSFSILIDVMKPGELTDGDVERAFPLLQTMVDPGDPAIWAPYVQRDRLVPGVVPDIYIGAALDDEVVPNSTNDLFAQGFSPPGVGEEVWAVHGIDFASGDVSGNGPDGASLGMIQFAEVHEDGTPAPAEHANLHDSDEGLAAIEAFFRPRLFDDEPALILDPH
ncbi:MAG: hypothetical protein GY913_26365 [Proteobacteria bacterium]|nr:hypothetical protein [Pseudomonadota bacterium]MCP4920441.1 hypothetical protein [Pseudomonadota bacterium]